MRDFERRTRLGALSLSTRVVYSVFLVFTLTAVGVSAWLAEEMVGLNLEGLDEYYAGISPRPESETGAVDEPSNADGPEIQLPGDGPDIQLPGDGPEIQLPGDGPEIRLDGDDARAAFSPEPKSLRSTLEVTHFHLFIMPLQWLVLAHLFALGGWSQRGKLWVVGISAAAVAGHIAAPWVARTGSALSTPFYAVTGLALALTFLVMTLVPLREMWLPKRSRDSGPAPSRS